MGPIFRKVWWHSVGGAAFIGVIALLQSQFTGCIPTEPPPPPPPAKSSRAEPAPRAPGPTGFDRDRRATLASADRPAAAPR
jgi:hypothetical protein